MRPFCLVPPGAWAQAITDALGFPNTGNGAPYECIPAKAGVQGREQDCIIVTAPGVTQAQVDAVMQDMTPERMEVARAAWNAARPKSLAEQVRELQDKVRMLELAK